jgi:purine nucleosidase
MRKLLIDTDTASDDAVAIIMALREPGVEVVALTTVAGNCDVAKTTKNCIISCQAAGTYLPPVYRGAARPILRDQAVDALYVHGTDGMGEMNLPDPERKPENLHACDAILKYAADYAGELELVSLGPVTNLAIAALKGPDVFKQIKHIYAMATSGFGPGNVSAVAEFNVWADAEAFEILLRSGVPITIVGWDMSMQEDAVLKADYLQSLLDSGSAAAFFAVRCNQSLRHFNNRRLNRDFVDLPDPVTMAVALYPDVLLEPVPCHAYTELKSDLNYGQVVFDTGYATRAPEFNATASKKINGELFLRKLYALLTK